MNDSRRMEHEKSVVHTFDRFRYYVRGEVDAWLEENKQDTWGEATITKPVAVSDMHAWLKAHPNSFIAAMPAK